MRIEPSSGCSWPVIMWVQPDDLIATLGAEAGNRLLDELGSGPSLVYDLVAKYGIRCEAVRNGTLHMSVGAGGLKEIREREAQWKRRGAPVEVHSAEKAHALSGAEGFTGALLDRRAGTIQPLAYARGLAGAAIAAGAEIFTDTPLLAASRQGDLWKLKTGRGTVTARHVILATNAYGGLVGDVPCSASAGPA